jgi:hypothetical protein
LKDRNNIWITEEEKKFQPCKIELGEKRNFAIAALIKRRPLRKDYVPTSQYENLIAATKDI